MPAARSRLTQHDAKAARKRPHKNTTEEPPHLHIKLNGETRRGIQPTLRQNTGTANAL